jgi:hypothetical protein
MKIEWSFKEAIYLIPVFCSDAFCFLFIRLVYAKPSIYIAWITPFIMFSWDEKIFDLWIGWINWGIVINFKITKYRPNKD